MGYICVGERELEQIFSQWQTALEEMHLPRWNELPELDLYMDQVIALMEKYLRYFSGGEEKTRLITPSIINNYVKLGIIPPPQKKKYSREHIADLVIICILKQTLSIPSILEILSIQKQQNTLPELLDLFCEMYEEVLRHNLDFACRTVEAGSYQSAIRNLPLKMAVYAHTGQLIAQQTLALALEKPSGASGEAEAKEEKKAPDKKVEEKAK